MAILLKSGGLFLHVPKTGGTWVTEVLEASDLVFAHVGGKHAGPPQLQLLEDLLWAPHHYDRANRPLFKFCFVRHPQRWYESWYRAGVTQGWPESPLADCTAPSFNGFIEKVLRAHPGFLSALYDSYTKDAHFVGRHERLAEDLLIALTYLRTTVDEAVVREYQAPNVSETIDVRLDWELQQALEAAERDAFVRFGYAMSDGTAPAPPATPAPFSHIARLAGPFVKEKGFAWEIAVEALARFADDEQHPHRSMVSLLENGMPLRPAHAPLDEVRTIGGGRFAHRGDRILFSTSDNTDPNETGRRYDLAWVYPAPYDATTLTMRQAA